jgi:hypothetical protein
MEGRVITPRGDFFSDSQFVFFSSEKGPLLLKRRVFKINHAEVQFVISSHVTTLKYTYL